jgi:hypothetical protein
MKSDELPSDVAKPTWSLYYFLMCEVSLVVACERMVNGHGVRQFPAAFNASIAVLTMVLMYVSSRLCAPRGLRTLLTDWWHHNVLMKFS